jgi:hypothetical protein
MERFAHATCALGERVFLFGGTNQFECLGDLYELTGLRALDARAPAIAITSIPVEPHRDLATTAASAASSALEPPFETAVADLVPPTNSRSPPTASQSATDEDEEDLATATVAAVAAASAIAAAATAATAAAAPAAPAAPAQPAAQPAQLLARPTPASGSPPLRVAQEPLAAPEPHRLDAEASHENGRVGGGSGGGGAGVEDEGQEDEGDEEDEEEDEEEVEENGIDDGELADVEEAAAMRRDAEGHPLDADAEEEDAMRELGIAAGGFARLIRMFSAVRGPLPDAAGAHLRGPGRLPPPALPPRRRADIARWPGFEPRPAPPLPNTVPAGRYFHGMVGDATRAQLLVFGGKLSVDEQRRCNDLWAVQFQPRPLEVTRCTLGEDLLHLLTQELPPGCHAPLVRPDLMLRCEGGATIEAHVLIVAARCGEAAARVREAQEDKDGALDDPNGDEATHWTLELAAPPRVGWLLLAFLYSDQLHADPNKDYQAVGRLLLLAKQFQLPRLLALCQKFVYDWATLAEATQLLAHYETTAAGEAKRSVMQFLELFISVHRIGALPFDLYGQPAPPQRAPELELPAAAAVAAVAAAAAAPEAAAAAPAPGLRLEPVAPAASAPPPPSQRLANDSEEQKREARSASVRAAGELLARVFAEDSRFTVNVPPPTLAADMYKLLHVDYANPHRALRYSLVLRAGNVEVRAHSLVLAARSVYFGCRAFAEMSNGDAKSRDGARHVSVSVLSPQALVALVRYLYCGDAIFREASGGGGGGGGGGSVGGAAAIPSFVSPAVANELLALNPSDYFGLSSRNLERVARDVRAGSPKHGGGQCIVS